MLRLIDANMNRAREGLRVLEDVARFVLDDRDITPRVRVLRHALGEMARPLTLALAGARRASEDIGGPPSEAEPREQVVRVGLESAVAANARRVAESLRVLEECAKVPGAPAALDAAALERARFQVYDVERDLLALVTRRARQDAVRGVYFIVDPALTDGRDPLAVARESIAGGVRVVQWRDKDRDKGIQLPDVRALRDICRQAGVILLINDHPDVAEAVDADGVHVGQKDLPLPVVRRLLRLDRIVGVSTATVEEARLAAEQGADYVAVGAMFPTQSKGDTRPAGLATLQAVRRIVRVPLVAIGGISRENVGQVVAAGADAVAVISAISLAADVQAAARHLVEGMAAAHDHE